MLSVSAVNWLPVSVELRAAMSMKAIRPRGKIQCVGLFTSQYNWSRFASESAAPPAATELFSRLMLSVLQRACMPLGWRGFDELSPLTHICDQSCESEIVFSFSCL